MVKYRLFSEMYPWSQTLTYSNHNNIENTNAPFALPLLGQRLGPLALKGGA